MDNIKDLWRRAWWGKAIIIIGTLFICGILSNLLSDSDTESDAPVSDAPAATQIDVPDATEEREEVEEAETAVEESDTAVPEPTSEPTPTEAPTDPPEPISLSGTGQTATEPVQIPFPLAVVSLSHNGSSNFIVQSFTDDGEDYLVNEIGTWDGQVLLSGDQEVIFDVDADGAWTIEIAPPGQAESAAFSGTGSRVSGVFDPPSNGPWEVSHDGESNFIVQLVCAGGSDYVQNEIGNVSGSTVVRFDRGPCLWVVDADGNWSLSPR